MTYKENNIWKKLKIKRKDAKAIKNRMNKVDVVQMIQDIHRKVLK